MSADEFQELREHAEHAQHDRSLAPVSLTMAILAVLVAVVSLLGHRAHTEEVVLQMRSTDQWAFYQAKNIRRHIDEMFTDLTAAENPGNAAVRDKYVKEAERYKDEQKEIENEARNLEREVAVERNRADRYDLAEVFLEIGLVITSITLLSGRRTFWYLGMVLGVIGLIAAGTGYMVR